MIEMRKDSYMYKCQRCGSEMVYTGTGNNKDLSENMNCDFYWCKCGKKIISEWMFNKDGSNKVFYDNIWRHNVDGSWSYWENGNWRSIVAHNWGRTRENQILSPKVMKFTFR